MRIQKSVKLIPWKLTFILIVPVISWLLIVRPVNAGWGGSEFSLTVDVSPGDGGCVQVDQKALDSYPSTSTYANGTYIQLKAIPAHGYVFTEWYYSLSGSFNPTTITIDCDKKVIAIFSPVEPSETDDQSSFYWWYIPAAIAILLVVGVAAWLIRKT